MKKLLLIALLLAPTLIKAQVSGAGQLSCSGSTLTGTAATSGTANNTVLANVTFTPAYGVLVQLDQTSTITGGAITFQVSYDSGTNYISVPVAQVLNPSTGAQLTNPYTLVASTNQSFLIVLAGASTFQVKLTTAITGTATVTPFLTAVCTAPTLGPLTLDSSGNLLSKVNVALPAGTNIVGKVGIDQTTPGTTNAVSATNLPTTVDTNSGNKSASTLRVVLATDQPQLTNKLLVTPDTNSAVNVAQVAGITTDTNSGNKSAGTQRVVLATDQPSMTNAQPYNLTQVNGVAVATDGGNGRQLVGTYPDTVTTSYHASKNVASAASATDISVLPGNATNTVLVNRVIVSCTQTTAGIITLQLIKRSTADTAGTSSSMTVVPDDSNYAAGVSAPLVYTANPTTGTAVGNIDTALVGCMATGTASPNDIYVFRPLKPIILRGTAQQVAVNLNGVSISGGSFNITYEYSETTTP